MATSSKSKVSLKLLIDTNGNRVLFAEAGKDFVDFLFYLLWLPVGSVTRLLTKQSMVGSLGNLYHSIENLSDTYFQPNQNKDTVLKPKSPISSISAAEFPLLLPDDKPSVSRKFYTCSNNSSTRSNNQYLNTYQYHPYVADDPSAVCPSCNQNMSKEVSYVAQAPAKEVVAEGEGGFVKGVVTYMVMDDLVVKPMSTISSITLLNQLNIKQVGTLEERVITLGMAEGLKLLKVSLQSNTVLTSVFLQTKKG